MRGRVAKVRLPVARHTKAARIRDMQAVGFTSAEIAARLKCQSEYVRAVKHRQRAKSHSA